MRQFAATCKITRIMLKIGNYIKSETDKSKCAIKNLIELPILINLIAINISGSVLSNVVLYRTCVHSLNHAEAVCESFLSPVKSNETHALEEAVQQHASLVISVKTVLEYIGPAILSLFMGVWSDTYGRKPLIVWPIFGMTCTGMLCVIYSMMDNLGPWWFIATSVPFSLTGGYVVMFTGAYCYVSDISTNKNGHTIRLTIVDGTIAMGQFAGSLMTSYLVLVVGYIYLLTLAACLNLSAYIIVTFITKESLTLASKGEVSKVFNFTNIITMFRECFKKRANYGRAAIMICSVVKAVSVLVLYGTSILEYMYTRQKLQWDLRQYNTYSSINTVISFAGGLFGVVVVQRLLRIGDILFSILTLVSASIEFTIKLFATNTLDMYISSVIAMFKGLLGPLLMTHLKKSLPSADIAKVLAFMCAAETVSPILAPITYNTLYAATVATFPSAIYLLSVLLSSLSTVLLSFLLYYSWKTSSATEPTHKQNEDVNIALI